MTPPKQSSWDGIERRNPNKLRRKADRRSYRERRSDTRDSSQRPRRKLSAWLRSLVRGRLGVDRRKNGDRRRIADRRNVRPSSLLTKEELADLLK